MSDTSERSKLLAIRYKKEVQLRKQLHDEIVQLKGNIRVFCRVRPLIKEDGDECTNVVSFSDDNDATLFIDHKESKRSFQMDRVFKPSSTQEEV